MCHTHYDIWQIVTAIRECRAMQRHLPTQMDVARRLNWPCHIVRKRLRVLRDLGYVTWQPDSYRSVREVTCDG